MNINHMRYAVEVAKTGSITQAAESLYMSQPNLSKALKEFELSLGFAIFKRTPRGIEPTKRGAEFIVSAKTLLGQIDDMESTYSPSKTGLLFSIAAPFASYVASAISAFANCLTFDRYRLNFSEFPADEVISCVENAEVTLGIIRCFARDEMAICSALAAKGIYCKTLFHFHERPIASKRHPLAGKGAVASEELLDFVEIANDNLALAVPNAKQSASVARENRQISVRSSGSQFELLRNIDGAYMFSSPLPQEMMDKYGLTALSCKTERSVYCDILISLKNHTLSDNETLFLELLEQIIFEMNI
ncbi:MAG: LysR family transcriptional regulator [Oscillospiraceae bacterium]